MKIELKNLREQDLPALVEICNNIDRQYMRNRMPYPYTDNDAKECWENLQKKGEGTSLFKLIWVDDIPIGSVSVEKQTDVYYQTGELGYCLRREYAGKGIMTKAVALICPMAFKQLALRRIMAHIYGPNSASRKVAEKNNFKLEGTMAEAVVKGDNVYDLCIYGLLRK